MTNCFNLNLIVVVVRQQMWTLMAGRSVPVGGGGLARGPLHPASTQDVDVDVVDRLASIWPIVNDDPVAFFQARIFSTFFCDDHQVAQQLRHRENL